MRRPTARSLGMDAPPKIPLVTAVRVLPSRRDTLGRLEAGSNLLTLSLPRCISVQSLNRQMPSSIWSNTLESSATHSYQRMKSTCSGGVKSGPRRRRLT